MMNFCASLFALAIRLYMARVFLWSCWLKISDWQTTLMLFQYEYKVPLVSPVVAAYLGTGAELIFGLLVVLGLVTRLSALGLLATNIVMVFSYPILMTPEGACMVKDHYIWGLMLTVLIFYGPGKWSLDRLIQQKVCPEYQY